MVKTKKYFGEDHIVCTTQAEIDLYQGPKVRLWIDTPGDALVSECLSCYVKAGGSAEIVKAGEWAFRIDEG